MEHLWSAVVEGSYRVSFLQAGLPCSWSTLFYHQWSQKGILTDSCPLRPLTQGLCPSRLLWAPTQSLAFLQRSRRFMAGWGASHHLSLHSLLLGKSCSAIWVVRTLIILSQMVYHPQTSCVFLSYAQLSLTWCTYCIRQLASPFLASFLKNWYLFTPEFQLLLI